MARNKKGPNITAQVLIYPATNLEFNTESHRAFAKGFGLDREQLICQMVGKFPLNSRCLLMRIRVNQVAAAYRNVKQHLAVL